MGNQLINHLKLHKKDLLPFLCGLIGFYLFGVLLLCFILWAAADTVSWFRVGSFMALLVLVGFAILSFLSYHQEFMLALSMGQTRKEFLVIFALRQLIWLLIAYGALFLLYLLEPLIYQAAFPGKLEEVAFGFLTDWRFILAVIPSLVLLNMFLGALYSRYGKKFGIILYLLWLGACFLVPRLLNHFEEMAAPVQSGIGVLLSWLLAIPPMGWIAIGAAAALAMLFTVIRLGMKQTVR